MISPDQIYEEKDYEGYGVFGGKDFFELLAEMNDLKTRNDGITLYYSNKDNIKYPQLSSSKDVDVNFFDRTEEDTNQGFCLQHSSDEEDGEED